MIQTRIWLAISVVLFCVVSTGARANAPAGETWFTIITPNFRVHHTAALEPYARKVAKAFEHALPELEKRMSWKLPGPLDVVVMDPSDSANGLAMSFPNTHIELFAAPFPWDSALGNYTSWTDELATHELTHIVANDTGLGFYKVLRGIFGSWVKPNGFQPVWLMEGLATFQETSMSRGGRGRSPLLESMLRVAVLEKKLNSSDYTSLDRFNDSVPWWPGGNTAYLLGYTIQALPTKKIPNLPGKVSYENAGNMPFSPNRALDNAGGGVWSTVWDNASARLAARFEKSAGEKLGCRLTNSGRHTGGQALSADGWLYFSEESWDHGYHLARVRADAACSGGDVERLTRKNYSGPTTVAVSPNGKLVAFSAFDPGFESLFSDMYLWSEAHGRERVTNDERVRDPAFLDDETLLYVRAEPDTSQTLVKRKLSSDNTEVLFRTLPFERLGGLHSRKGRIFFALHDNAGHEKLHELVAGRAVKLVAAMDDKREFERNPFLADDGSLYFAASYGNSTQDIYKLAPFQGDRLASGAQKPERVMASSSGFLDRPVALASGELIVQAYALNGFDLAKGKPQANLGPAPQPTEDLHEYLTGEKPYDFDASGVQLPASAPYSATGTTGIGLWPQYWFPEVYSTQDGWLAGASTSGNDALSYHRWFATMQYDSRAKTFPVYRAYYRNRSEKVAFHFEASQTNNYFSSVKASNRNASYSLEAIFPLWDFTFSFGSAYREKLLFGGKSDHFLLFNNVGIDRAGKTPSAIAPNWGWSFNNFVALYPSSKYDTSFTDERPELHLYLPGLWSSHSVSLGAAAGFSNNTRLTSNYYQGGGPSTTDSSAFTVRGYPTDTLFGTKIATGNFSYTLPLAHIHHGWGTKPFFLSSLGLRFVADAGTANYHGIYSGDGKNFRYYEFGDLGKRWIYGYGGELLVLGSILYHIPLTVITGVHHGTEKRYGGTTQFYFALGVGLDRGTMRRGERTEFEQAAYDLRTSPTEN